MIRECFALRPAYSQMGLAGSGHGAGGEKNLSQGLVDKHFFVVAIDL